MGRWSESEFGRKTLSQRAYLFAGTSRRKKVEAVVDVFDEVLVHRYDVYERYFVRDSREEATLLFQLYGAPIMCDIATVLADGEVEEVVFLGYAYGIPEDMQVGECVIPTQVQTLDGVSRQIGAGDRVAPDPEMNAMIAGSLRKADIPFREGKTVSVPATLWHGDESLIDPEAIALELEYAALCHCGREEGLKVGGVLIISDNQQEGLLDRKTPYIPRMLEVFRAIKEDWRRS